MAQTQSNAKDMNGFNIYHSKNQTIYWDAFSKTAYIISNSEVNTFTTWQLKLPFCMLATLLLVLFGMSTGFSLIAGLVAYIISEIFFRVKYLPTLPVSLKWQKPKSEGFIKDTAKKFRYSSIVTMAVMFGGFGIMFLVYVFFLRSDIDGAIVYAIFATASLVGMIITIKIAKARKAIDLTEKNK